MTIYENPHILKLIQQTYHQIHNLSEKLVIHMNVLKSAVWQVKIRSSMMSMSQSEQKVAAFFLQHGSKVLDMGISNIAIESSVSDATVVRFCRTLGYNGLKDFKMAIAQEDVKNDDVQLESRRLETGDSAQTLVEKLFTGSAEALSDTLEAFDFDAFEAAVDVLSGVKYIDAFAIGGSASVAKFAQHSFRKIGVRLNICSEALSGSLMSQGFDKNDVVLAISNSGETAPVVSSVARAKADGARIISIIGTRHSSLEKLSNICLFSAARCNPLPGDRLYKRMAQLVTLNALYSALALRMK